MHITGKVVTLTVGVFREDAVSQSIRIWKQIIWS